MSSLTYEDELKAAIDFQVLVQLKPLEDQMRFHEGHMNAEIVGGGHRNALTNVQYKIAALNRCKEDHSLLTEKMKSEALQAYRLYKNKLEEMEAEQKKQADLQKQKYEEDVRKAIVELSTKGFGLQPQGNPHRKYIRDVNC